MSMDSYNHKKKKPNKILNALPRQGDFIKADNYIITGYELFYTSVYLLVYLNS